ncbi:MAG: hypothetical protein ACTSWY_08740 [Promethearchaeota archaeon]
MSDNTGSIKSINSTDSIIKFSNELNSLIESIINAQKNGENGENSESNTNELKNLIISKGTLSLLDDYKSALIIFRDILHEFEQNPPNALVFLIMNKIKVFSSNLDSFITVIETASKIAKEPELTEDIIEKTQKVRDNFKKIVKNTKKNHDKALEHYSHALLIKPLLINSDTNGLDLTESSSIEYNDYKYYAPAQPLSELEFPADKWYYINFYKKTPFTVEKKRNKTPVEYLFEPILKKIKDIIKKNQREKKFVTLDDIINFPEFKELKNHFINLHWKRNSEPNIRDKELNSPIMYILYRRGYIIEVKNPFIDSLSKKKISKQLSDYILNSYRTFLKNTLKSKEDKKDPFSAEPCKDFSRVIISKEREFEHEAQNLEVNEVNDNEKTKFFQNKIQNLYELVNRHDDWFLELRDYLKPYQAVIRKQLKSISEVRNELDRKSNEFTTYLDTVAEQNIRENLNNEIGAMIEQLEQLLKNYETEASEIILKEIPGINKLTVILENFQKKINLINGKVTKIFSTYNEQNNFSIYDSVKRWEKRHNEIQNQINFVVSAMVNSFYNKFKAIIKKEQNLFTSISEFPVNGSLNLLNHENLSERQLREQLQSINDKIDEIEQIRIHYQEKKAIYEAEITKYIQARGEISQQCYICHKKIDIVNDKYIKCEFCGRLSHYLCCAWWLEKHNSCPVCNNKYVLPNQDLFKTGK